LGTDLMTDVASRKTNLKTSQPVFFMSLFEELQDLTVKYHFRPEKKFSQFFCIDEDILDLMVESAELSPKDVVLEVGPGTGFLTKRLLEKCKVVAVEKSRGLYELLSEEFAKEIASGKLTLIPGDILEQDFSKLKVNKIVSLPPYHISSKLTAKIVLSKIEKAVLMFDSGFLEKITAFKGLRAYGLLSVMFAINSKISIVKKNIPNQSFFPAPNCPSVIVKIDLESKNNSYEFYCFLRELFRHKNKNLSRSFKQAKPFLKKEFSLSEEEAKEKIEELGLAETKVVLLSPEQILEVFEALIKK